MTSSEEKINVASMKQKLINHMSPVKEETRSFLNFSRENLSISHSDLEEGFNRSRLKPSKNTILSIVALIIAVLCLGLESWELHCSLSKLHDIDQLKRDVESLKHRLLEQDLLDELKAFEQLYTEESTEDNDPGEADIDNADYDSNYNDDDSTSRDYTDDRTSLSYDSKLDLSEITSTSVPALYPESESNRAMEILTAFRKAETKRGEKFVKNVRESHKNIDRRERLKEEHNARLSHEKNVSANVTTEHKRDNDARDIANTGDVKEGVKSKRSVSDHTIADDPSADESNYQHEHHVRTVGSGSRLYANGNRNANNNSEKNPASHSSKKYHSRARPKAFSLAHNDQLSQEFVQHTNLSTETAVGERVNWRNTLHNDTANGTEIRRSKFPQIYAIHFGADTTLFSSGDEHVGNGKARHNNGIFKAWQPSDWVADLGMNRHFTLATDGKLTVHEPGLYLVYAQIHYLDDHDENGFRLLVNGRSIMQCMVYSPGTGHKSRSCFSAQVTVLQTGDHLILKDIGTARYTLFQHDKSFFGLTKLGELGQHRQQPTPSTPRHQPQQTTY
ncbi:protein eiger isoform X2 [Pseudomyrmex gracilis]|uniref:protein eiger isoform X2 n=1 Tax=Pseudomyrmex gracilis TaxID=219809 RepID=UPI000995C541|nr:protein eiger isoform X2 [Pseudomyrmex gracilis]